MSIYLLSSLEGRRAQSGLSCYPLSVTDIAHTTIGMEEILTSADEMLEGIGEKHHTVRLLMNLRINTRLSLERQ